MVVVVCAFGAGGCATFDRTEGERVEPGVFGLGVETRKDERRGVFVIELMEGARVVARAESMFGDGNAVFDAAERAGRTDVFASRSGQTVVVVEDASESSPQEQVVVFRRGPEGWSVGRYRWPHRPGPLYGFVAEPFAVSDGWLWCRWGDGGISEVAFSDLGPR